MDMLTQLRAKASGTAVPVVVAEGARLPFPAGRFDAVVIARLLYLTPDWRAILDETHQVLRVGGRLLHEWSNGQADEEWVQIREEARRLFEQAGLQAPFHPGVRAEADADRETVSLGFVREVQLDLGRGRRSRSESSCDVLLKASCHTSGMCQRTCGRSAFHDSSAGLHRGSISSALFRCRGNWAGRSIERMLPNVTLELTSDLRKRLRRDGDTSLAAQRRRSADNQPRRAE
jgi:SAM-dependent methyltransferase